MYEAPKIGDLGQITEHVFQKLPLFSPEQDQNVTGQVPGQGTGTGLGVGNQGSTVAGVPTTGAGAGLAGLGLIGALFAGLASRSSSENPTRKPSDVPTESGRGEP